MAGGKSPYLSNALLDHVLGGGDYTRAATVYIGLLTSLPSDVSGITEVTGGSYARVSVANNATNWPASSTQVKRNATIIDWGTAGADLGTITAIGEFDASSGGNMLTYGVLTIPVTIISGDPFSIAVNAGEYSYLDV